MHFICIYLLALLHIFEYTRKDELYPAIGKEELFQMLHSKNKKRGFTLVELIVVLVILAILAALLIPALTGYIDKAKKDQVIAETRMLHEAIQTEMTEIYASNIDWKTSSTAQGTGAHKTLASKNGTACVGSAVLPDAQQRYMRLLSSPKFLVCRMVLAISLLLLPVTQKFMHWFTIRDVDTSVYTSVTPSNMLHIKSVKNLLAA